MGLSGLAQINIELTSRCNRHTLCGFCGHQNPAVHPGLRKGNMHPCLIEELAGQVASLGKNLIVQFHRDGDPLAYPALGVALELFEANTRSLVTHGETLAEKADDLIENCEVVTVSIFRGDPDREIQLDSLRTFLALKGDRAPRVLLKVVGDMTDEEMAPYLALGLPVMRRLLHVASSNATYARSLPAMPEHGICLDLLHHPSVAWDGRVFLCNRLDTTDAGFIGDATADTLEAIWNGPVRQAYLHKHLEGKRAEVPPCKTCEYYGVPTA